MTRLDKVVIACMLAVCALSFYGLRRGESLSCAVLEGGQGLSCERIQQKLFATTDEHIWVPDTRTIELRLSSLAGRNDANAPAIVARDENGHNVVLLGVTERAIVDAQVLAGRLHAPGAAVAAPITFRRGKSRGDWLLIIVSVMITALYPMLAFRRARMRRTSGP